MKILNSLQPKNISPEKELNKILFILQLPPPVHGSSMVGQYIKESQVINATFNCRYINSGISNNVNEIGKIKLSKILNYLSILIQTIRQLIKFKPDLCYVALTASGAAFYKDVLVILLIKLFNVKLVYHFHNKGVSTRQHQFIDNLLYVYVFKNTDVILLSKYLYSDIQSYVPESKIHICPNGIPVLNKLIRRDDKIQNEIVKILFLSNLIESKGVFILLEACSILKQRGISFECTFIGGEGDVNIAQFKNKVQLLGLLNHVNYLGKKLGNEKNQAFINADIFAFPTYYHNECFPLVLLEAMQHELPIVSTFEGGIKDIVEDGKTGFLVQQKNVLMFAEKLETIIKSKDMRTKMGKAGKRKYEQEFTHKKFEIRLAEILNLMVN